MNFKFRKNRMGRYVFIASIFFLILSIGAMIALGIVQDRTWSKEHKYRSARDETYQNIVNYLEYNGLDDTAMQLMSDFSSTYSEYANFIVVDSDFNIKYHLNRGFINDEGKFHIITDESGRVFACDAEGNILSTHGLETSNVEALRKLTNRYVATVGSLPVRESEISSETAHSVTVVADAGRNRNSMIQIDGNGYITYVNSDAYYSTNLRFHSIQSKNLNLCFIYDENDPLWSLRTYNSDRYSTISSVLGVTGGLSFFFYWTCLATFVFLDARRHDNHPALWGVLTLFTNVVGLVVYLAVRPERIYCSSCREPLAKNHSFCPICGTRNRAKCVGCGVVVQSEWAFCVNCGAGVADVPTESTETQRRE